MLEENEVSALLNLIRTTANSKAGGAGRRGAWLAGWLYTGLHRRAPCIRGVGQKLPAQQQEHTPLG